MASMLLSILNNDQYKFSMQNAVLKLFPQAFVSYKFRNRGTQRFSNLFLEKLRIEINEMRNLSLTNKEYDWLKENCPYFDISYLEYLKNFRFKPEQVDTSLDETNDLVLDIKGYWHETILWEVPLMSIISELYFKYVDTSWIANDTMGELSTGKPTLDQILVYQHTKAYEKADRLSQANCLFVDFGSRRRRSFDVQSKVIEAFLDHDNENKKSTFIGTSNLLLARKFGIKGIGSIAHEWIQGNSVLEGLRNANYYAMQNWVKVYNTDLGIALTDTYGIDAFLRNFNKRLAALFQGCRHDSGDPFIFTDKIVSHYKKLGINPQHKTLVFSDGLNIDKAIEIKKYCGKKINCSFGIGTHFSNDIEDSPALNMVIKLWTVNDIPVIKLSDSPGKEMGDKDAIRVAKWTFFDQPLDIF